jgi:hypothetical protein
VMGDGDGGMAGGGMQITYECVLKYIMALL